MRELEGYFRGLSDVTRLRIMNLLLHGELCVCDIQRILDASQPSISRHLNYLKHAGLVLDRRDGLRVFYRVVEEDKADLKALHEFLRKAFEGKSVLENDLKQLRDAMAKGACAVPPPIRTSRPALSGVTDN
jgi:ArsR family transcriptional regulator